MANNICVECGGRIIFDALSQGCRCEDCGCEYEKRDDKWSDSGTYGSDAEDDYMNRHTQ